MAGWLAIAPNSYKMKFSSMASISMSFASLFTVARALYAITAPWDLLACRFDPGHHLGDIGDGTPGSATVNLYLMSGPLTALQLVGAIAVDVDGAAGQYSWDISCNNPTWEILCHTDGHAT
ncbi:hypothetical protein B0H10DRAFT_2074154 [Mycena sp. CBHHK59/15]|nr:hypothetical protein B0H10DRAFT_2074154 [Mycena sp. CBHHK59/15]